MTESDLLRHPADGSTPVQELIFKACYAPVAVEELLSTADGRSRLRRVPAAQLYFALQNLSDEDLERLLPHITENQWTTILVFDVWARDGIYTGQFLRWEHFLTRAEPAVAKKLLRATDPELWLLTFQRELRIYGRLEQDEFEGEPDEAEEWLVSPDQQFLIILPDQADKARLLRSLLQTLFEVDPEQASQLLQVSRWRTPTEVEERAYQQRRGRLEDLGFQDYFEAIEIYTLIRPDEPLPKKQAATSAPLPSLPVPILNSDSSEYLLWSAMASLPSPDREYVLEELFYVCNRLVAADRVSPSEPGQLKDSIKKVAATLNLGLDWWAQGRIDHAAAGLRAHFLVSFFQLGHSLLMGLQEEIRALLGSSEAQPGSVAEALITAACETFPRMVFERKGRIQDRYFETAADLKSTRQLLEDSGFPVPPA
jgi:hypothetical protein